MTEWRVQVDGTTEPDLFDVDVVINANPFGDHGTAYISDYDGTKSSDYPEGARVDFQYREFDSGNSFTDKLNGYVVEARPQTDAGADVLEVDVYGLNTLLRRNDVNADISGQSITNALKQVIEDYTAASWNASKVDVVDDTTVTRSFANERVDNVIQALRRKSGFEAFGVDSNLDFFFRSAETKTVSPGIGPGDWSSYDFPEQAQESLNEVAVFFDDGDRAVIVDDSGAKRELKDTLNAARPVTFGDSAMRKQVKTRSDAVAVGEQMLADRASVSSGVVETFGLLDADPGDTLPIKIPQAGVNDERIIAQLEYSLDDTVEVTVVDLPKSRKKSRDPHSDMLVRQSDTLQRVEMRPAVGENDLEEVVRALDTLVGARFDVSGSVDGTPIDEGTLTNGGFKAIRDGVINQSAVGISSVVVGTGDSQPSRTQSSLGSQSESVSASTSTSGTAVDVTGSLSTADDIVELGIEDSNGTLLLRAVLDGSVSSPSNVSITVDVNDDDDLTDSVLTTTGQKLLRDVLAATSPTYPDEFALGDNSGSLDVSDTSLGNRLVKRSLGNEILREESSGDEWTRIADQFQNTDKPFVIKNDKLQHAQTAFVLDAQDDTIHDSTTSGGEFTGSTAVSLTGSGNDLVQHQFRADSDDAEISASDVSVVIRARDNNGSSELRVVLNGTTKIVSVTDSLEWQEIDISADITTDLNTLIIDGSTSITNDVDLDVVAALDGTEYTVSNFDNSTGGSGDYLADPKLYPSQTDIRLGATDSDLKLDRATDEITVSSVWNDTSNSQALVIEGNVNSNTTSATQSITQTDTVEIDLRLSRFGSRTGTTPTEGFNAQTVDSVQIESGAAGAYADGTRRIRFESFVARDTINGNTVREAGLLDANDDLLSRSLLGDTLIESGVSLTMTEILRLRAAALSVNESNFDVTIDNVAGVADDNLSGAYYQMRIVDAEAYWFTLPGGL